MEDSSQERDASPTPWSDILVWTVFLWGWALPSALFWELKETHQVLLPHIPNYCWMLPGELWQAAPWLFVVIVLVLPGLFSLYARKHSLALRPWRKAAYFLFALVFLVHLAWGGAILGSVGL